MLYYYFNSRHFSIPKYKIWFRYFMGSTHFQEVIFYLWTDPSEICTAYVKLNSNSILLLKIFWISIWFSKKIGIFYFSSFFKRIEVKIYFLWWRKIFKQHFRYFQKYAFLDLWAAKKIRPENWKSRCIILCGIQCRFQNWLCFSSSKNQKRRYK